ncbi:T9SS type A sorting domain-containing protein [Bacteroidota bacterium]
MRTLNNFLFILIVALIYELSFQPIQAQELLPDTVWSKQINQVNVVKFSPDGKYIIASTSNYGVNQLDTQTGAIIRTIMLGNNRVSFSATGDTLVLSAGNQITLIRTKTGEIIDTIIFSYEIYPDCEAIITPDGKSIIATTGLLGSDKPQLLVIDIETKENIRTFIGKYSQTSQLTISPDGKYFSFRDFQGKGYLFLMDLNTYEEIAMIEYPDGSLFDNVFSWDSKILGAISYRNGVFLWNIETLKLIKNFKFNGVLDINYGVRYIKFTNDNENFVFAYFDEDTYKFNKIIVWNIKNDTMVYEYPFSGQNALDVSKDDYIAAWGRGYLSLLRPKWQGTDIIDPLENELNHTINNGIIRIKFDENLMEKPEINIYNILGMNVGARHTVPLQQGNTIEMDIDFLNPGVYFVVINYSGNIKTLKILKE